MAICTLCREERGDNFYRGRGQCRPCRRRVGRMLGRGEVEAYRAELEARNAKWRKEYAATNPWLSRADGPWKPVVGYEGLYEVSARGVIASLWFRNGLSSMPRTAPHSIKTFTHPLGYKSFTAVDWSGKRTTTHVHRAVLFAFAGAPPVRGMECGHRNSTPSDNRLENLRWVTFVENEKDKIGHGTAPRGSRNPWSKLDERKVRRMRKLEAEGHDRHDLAKLFDVSYVTVWKIVTRRGWTHV